MKNIIQTKGKNIMTKIKTLTIGVMMAVALAGNVNAGNYLNQSCVEYLKVERPDETKADIQDICNIISSGSQRGSQDNDS